MKTMIFQDAIQRVVPFNQDILVGYVCAKWQNIVNRYPIVEQVFRELRREGQGQIVVSREDIFTTPDIRRRIIKALIWGYPKGMQGNANLQNVIDQLDCIVRLISEYQEGLHSRNRFLALCRSLYEISGLKQSTLGKILYFCEVTVGRSQAVIIDANVLSAFECFDEFYDASYESDPVERYLRQLFKINAVARSLHVSPDQIEYFLFELGKEWKREKTAFLRTKVGR